MLAQQRSHDKQIAKCFSEATLVSIDDQLDAQNFEALTLLDNSEAYMAVHHNYIPYLSLPWIWCASFQDKEAAQLLHQDQRSMFEEWLAQSAQSASDQRTNFEERLAQSALCLSQAVQDASEMRAAYELGAMLASEDAEEKRKSSIEVRS